MTGIGSSLTTDTGIWQTDRNSGALQPIAREGHAAPGGGRFHSFTSLGMVPNRGVMFTAKLISDGVETTSATDGGLWALDNAGALRRLLREGDIIPARGTVRTFTVLSSVVGSGGQTRAVTPGVSDIVVRVEYTSGGEDIVRISAQ